MTPADKPEPVAWMYERKLEEWPPAAPVVQLTRWAEDDLARPFWTETPLYTRPTSDLAERFEGLVEANQRLRNGYADAVSGLQYILARHGRLDGVGFDRVMDHFFEWVTMPEREGLQAGSHKLTALKEVNSHD